MRASRLDSWLIISAICLRFSSLDCSGPSIRWIPDGSERRAHLVRDEMDSLLVMMTLGFSPPKRPPHHEMLVAGGGDGPCSQADAEGAKAEKPAVPEQEERYGGHGE